MGEYPFPLRRPETLTGIELAESIDSIIENTHGEVLRRFKLMDYVWTTYDPSKYSFEEFGVKSQKYWDSLRLSACDYVMVLRWRQTRIVYDVDGTLMRSLADMATDDVLPGEIFRQLPHPNPLFVFPAGHPITMADGREGRIRGMIVTGQDSEGVHCSTHDERADSYQLTFLSDILNGSGEVVDFDILRISFRLGTRSITIRQLVQRVLARGFTSDPLIAQQTEEQRRTRMMEEMARFGIAHLLYVCADKADVEKPVASRTVKKGKNAGQPTKEAVISHPVGYHVGAAITRFHEIVEHEKKEQASTPTGRTVRPHVRRAHLHTFRYGTGRKLSKVKWLPPIFVRANGEQVHIDGTVVPVRR